jgi:hypothetical protein
MSMMPATPSVRAWKITGHTSPSGWPTTMRPSPVGMFRNRTLRTVSSPGVKASARETGTSARRAARARGLVLFIRTFSWVHAVGAAAPALGPEPPRTPVR